MSNSLSVFHKSSTSFLSPPASTVLEELFRQAEQTDAPLMAQFKALDESGRQDFFTQLHRGDYRAHYGGMRENFLAVSPELGRLLYLLARTRRAQLIVEFGLSLGLSAIHLASALRDNGGGHLITTELEPAKAARAEKNLEAAGLSDLVEIRVGDALETLRNFPAEPIDLVLLDGAKGLYLPVLKLLEPQLQPGALVVTDNTSTRSPYLDYVRDPANGYVSLTWPFEEGTELSLRVA